MNEIQSANYPSRPDAQQLCKTAPQQVISERENKIRTLSVRQLNYGYLIEVGCHTFAIETSEKVILKLSEYINNPASTEEKWFNGGLL